jgi:hypothetical protein
MTNIYDYNYTTLNMPSLFVAAKDVQEAKLQLASWQKHYRCRQRHCASLNIKRLT